MTARPVMLVILDGFGWREATADNAVRLAHPANFASLWSGCPHAFLNASGRSVGLPDGQMGNSEVGHLTIGAGRVIKQELVRIGDAVEDGSIATRSAFVSLVAALKELQRKEPPSFPLQLFEFTEIVKASVKESERFWNQRGTAVANIFA